MWKIVTRPVPFQKKVVLTPTPIKKDDSIIWPNEDVEIVFTGKQDLHEDVEVVFTGKQDPNIPPVDYNKLIIERMEKLEQQNILLQQQLQTSSQPKIRNPKERYVWPRTYSYKLWNWVPILSYTTKKQDPTRDLVFQKNWIWEDNHLLCLSLADWKKVDVLIKDFWQWYTKSDKMFATVIMTRNTSDWNPITLYEFEHQDYGKFVVDSNVIN